MDFSCKPDFDKSWDRYSAFWEQEIIDRPPVSIILPAPKKQEVPQKEYTTYRERWLDVEFRAENMEKQMANRIYYADALPVAWPNMGPEIFSAWCGCDYYFGERTAWSEPCIEDWERDAPQATMDPEHPLFTTTVRFTDLLLERGKGKFIVGLTDLHPGGDHLAALRDPQRLAMDLIENPQAVKDKLASSMKEYYKVYDFFYKKLREAGMPITSWTPLIACGRFYIPSNDFSCMISSEMFREFFLPQIRRECRFYDRSIYHLDGPDALRHLDDILSIEDLDAVQWVYGAGNEGFSRWIDVYRRIQAAGKSLQLLEITLDELPLVFETLQPEGIWFSSIRGIKDRETADRVLARIQKWE